MESNLLKDYPDNEKGAYLGAIASLATADHAATAEELKYISELADAMGISASQKQMALQAGSEITGDELERCLDILKNSELRFSLITELISFSKSDGNYDDQEKNDIKEISRRLEINNTQFSLLDHFVTKTDEVKQPAGEVPKQGFLESLGLSDKFKSEGMNMGALGKGLLAFAAPMLLGKMFGGNRSGKTGRSNSPLNGGMLGGGLGSLLSMLSMGRGFGNTGGLLSKILNGNKTAR